MDAYELTSPERKLVMWYKVKELSEKGLSIRQISRELGLDRKTVRRYLHMTREEFDASKEPQVKLPGLSDQTLKILRQSIPLGESSDKRSSKVHPYHDKRSSQSVGSAVSRDDTCVPASRGLIQDPATEYAVIAILE